jgi:predicted transcriptional regulator
MAIKSLDAEINRYLPLLGNEEKKSLLGVIKSFLQLKKDQKDHLTIEQYNKEIDEALAQVKEGKFVTQDELEKEMEKW